jgi:hypothetical protein
LGGELSGANLLRGLERGRRVLAGSELASEAQAALEEQGRDLEHSGPLRQPAYEQFTRLQGREQALGEPQR